MVPVRHTLTEMGCHHPPSQIQCDNSTAIGMTNSTLVPRKSKSWDLRLNCFDAKNPKSNSVTIGTRVIITGVITAQNITQ